MNWGQQAIANGNSVSQLGADIALASAIASLFGLPAEPGIALGGDIAGVGAVVTVIGSLTEYLGGILAGNANAIGNGYLSGIISLLEGIITDVTTAKYGLNGLPSFVQDPLDAVIEEGSSGAPCL